MSGVAALGVCFALAGLPSLPPLFVPVTEFTLAWTHSIEKVRWEEDYAVESFNNKLGARLVATQARIKGSAAGMEPPEKAVLHNGWYEYKPAKTYPSTLRLMRSKYVPDYRWCQKEQCLPLSAVMPSDGDVTLVYACTEHNTAQGE
ncbi:DUF1850 domain-containing protein [Neopusillimonas maritima]|uniref:DUF1850 domain-containing protein n=1 Tax=Neopusillimonas maritima TaxID=2026239 RepID=A0ABX9MYL5_9BURK|nr:DUF1850 domain-containing protein [Neopusillimonas maritima]RII83932.1 hypothetical protein CJO09_01445 [Neopusillimonas maritima]|tara:strand:+ start:708 stop:1145 length:438 start_codon:yes stop_codon:yes gene_type:complete